MEKRYCNSTHPGILFLGLSISALMIFFIYQPPYLIVIFLFIILYILISQLRSVRIKLYKNKLTIGLLLLGINYRTIECTFDSVVLDSIDVLKFRQNGKEKLELAVDTAVEEKKSLSMTVRDYRKPKPKEFEIGTQNNNTQIFKDVLDFCYKSSKEGEIVFKTRYFDNRVPNAERIM